MFFLALLVVFSIVPRLAAQQSTTGPSISQMSTSALLKCAREDSCNAFDWDVADELRQRLGVYSLIAMYPNQNARLKRIIVYALYHAKGRDVESLMRVAAFPDLKPGRTDPENHYFSLQYLAKLCDQHALKELNRPENYKGGYPVSCMQWQTTLTTFGRCGYKAAVPLLAGNLDDACVNNILAAEGSLRELMPKSKCWKKAGLDGNFQAEATCYANEYHVSRKQ